MKKYQKNDIKILKFIKFGTEVCLFEFLQVINHYKSIYRSQIHMNILFLPTRTARKFPLCTDTYTLKVKNPILVRYEVTCRDIRSKKIDNVFKSFVS